jgi:hypothetical protein
VSNGASGLFTLRPNMCAHQHNRSGIPLSGLSCAPRKSRCDEVVTYQTLRQGKNYLPGVGGFEGKPSDRAPGRGGRGSFTLYVLLGPSLAVGLALAAFSFTRDAVDAISPATSAPTASPSGSAEPATSAVPARSIGPAGTPDTRTPVPTNRPTIAPTTPPTAPPTVAPTAPPVVTNPPTAAPTASPTPAPTNTLPLPTLPPLPTPIPTLPLRLP